LVAAPSQGFRFSGWTGGCTGVGLSCKILVKQAGTVSARFSLDKSSTAVPLDIKQADFAVRWHESVGTGKLTVKGNIAKKSSVQVQLSQTSGTPLITEHLELSAGPFSLTLKLEPGLLARGAELLPGGFVISISGSSGKLVVPTQVKTVTLPAPPEGVVDRAFASASENGRPATSLQAKGRKAVVTFEFQTLPQSKAPITIAWFRPDGKLLGVANKAASPTVSSSISSPAPLPTGTWHAELRAGSKVVKNVLIHVQ
jgi:hypothetical protein